MTQELRDKDTAVLQAIHDGATNTSEIREATTLTNREINYSLNKYLEPTNLVHIERSEGREWTEINGHQKKIWKPKNITLTDQGLQKIAQIDTDNQYEDMTKRELIQQLQELEERQDRLENIFKDFRKKVMEKI